MLEVARNGESVRASFFLFGNTVRGALLISVSVVSGYFVVRAPNDPGFTPADLSRFTFLIAILVAHAISLAVFQHEIRVWDQKMADITAICLCFVVLSHCWKLARGKEGVLATEYYSSVLRARLGDFATTSDSFIGSERKASVLRHVASVQKDLTMRSGSVLSDGVSAIPDAAKAIILLLERLVEERWLGLLDLPDTLESEQVIQSSVERTSRRDGFIVIGGSAAAALMVGVAGATGLPVTAAIPAALIFLLGPAMLWGGRRLGMSPKVVLGSMANSMTGAGAAETPSARGESGNT
ncbi:hypothetical protein AB0H92_06825 [Streptomyces phaeochromogenes]|uniref:hypothetical protein n=1 Tax=Streptomyces phaeochromogenes TaxID=1923 RepID=UPI0033EF0C23